MLSRTLHIGGPLDLEATLGVLGLTVRPVASVQGNEALWATRSSDGPVTVHLMRTGNTVSAVAYGPGGRWALEQLPRFLGLDDEPREFRPHPGIVAELHRRAPGFRLGHTGRVFEALMPTIVAQRVTTESARRSMRALIERYGAEAPGLHQLRLLPAPEVLAALDYADLHPAGIERKRAVTLIEVARRAARMEEIMGLDIAAGRERLLAVRGVGEWTAGHVMGMALGDRDAVPLGDLHLPSLVTWLLAGEEDGDDDRMVELLERYRPQRRRVVLLMKRSGLHPPRRGPRRQHQPIDWW